MKAFNSEALARLKDRGEANSLNGEFGERRSIQSEDPDDSAPRLSVALKESSGDEIYASQAVQAARCPDISESSNASQSPPGAPAEAVGAPAPPDLLDPAVLRTMPPRVAAFMLYQPPDPPRWRTSLSADGLDDGVWCG